MFIDNPVTKFKKSFLNHLKKGNCKDVLIYDFINRYYAKNHSKISLLKIKDTLLSLYREELFTSTNYSIIFQNKFSINNPKIEEDSENYKKNVFCSISDKGLEYLRKERNDLILKISGIIAALATILSLKCIFFK